MKPIFYKKKKRTYDQYILSNIDIRDRDECWPWILPAHKTGYGRGSFNNKQFLAHRASYEYFKEPIPKGLVIDHICKNRICVNPNHLRVVTNLENVTQNSNSLTVKLKNQTHCKRGHLFDEENTYSYKNSRQCKICFKLRLDKIPIDELRKKQRQWYKERKERSSYIK